MNLKAKQAVMAHYQAGNFVEVIELCRQELENNRSDADTWCLMGIALKSTGSLERAVMSYREAIRL